MEPDNHLDSAYLDTASTAGEPTWSAEVLIGTKKVNIKLDLEAEVTAILHQHIQVTQHVTLTKPPKVLYSPGRHLLKVIGQFLEMLLYNEKLFEQQIYVAKVLRTQHLGLPALTSFNLAARVYDIESH